jgi:hypothetical protein
MRSGSLREVSGTPGAELKLTLPNGTHTPSPHDRHINNLAGSWVSAPGHAPARAREQRLPTALGSLQRAVYIRWNTFLASTVMVRSPHGHDANCH